MNMSIWIKEYEKVLDKLEEIKIEIDNNVMPMKNVLG